MSRKKVSIPIEGWFSPNIDLWQNQLHRSREITNQKDEPSCILGSPEFADRLLAWLQDTEEDLNLQIWLYFDSKTQKLQSHLRLEVEGLDPKRYSDWEKDVDTLIALHDSPEKWKSSKMATDWSKGVILEILDHSEEEADFQATHVQELFQLLKHRKEQTAVVISLSFHWKRPSTQLPNHPIQRRRERKGLKRERHLYREARRRICILSATSVTSLIKQSVFRAFAGTGPRYGKWHKMSPDMVTGIITGPQASLSIKACQPLNDRVTLSELRESITANLVPHEIHHDSIPF